MSQTPGWASPQDPHEPADQGGQPNAPASTPPPEPPSAPVPDQWGVIPGPGRWGAVPAAGAPMPGQNPPGQNPPGQNPPGQWGAPAAPGGWGEAGGWAAGQAPPGWGGGQPWTAAPRPGIVPLRPLSLGDLYDGSFQSIRTNPRTMVGTAALVAGVVSLLSIVPQAAALVSFSDSTLFDPQALETATPGEIAGDVASLFGSVLLPALVQALALAVVTGLLIVAVSEAVIGRRTTAGALWRRTRRRVPAIIGLILLQLVAVIALIVVLAVPGLLMLTVSPVAGGVLIAIGLLVGVLGALALYVAVWALALPAMLLEDLGVVAALGRSRRLVMRSFWRVLGIMLLTYLMLQILSGIVSLPFSVAGTLVTINQDPSDLTFVAALAQSAVAAIGAILSSAILYPFSAAVTTLLYVDLRMRQEGLDVELLRAADDTAAS